MGLFSRKPTLAEEEQIVLASKQSLPVLVHVARGRVTYDDGRFVDLTDPDQRAAVIVALESVVNHLQLATIPAEDFSAFIEELSKRLRDHINAASYEAIGPIGHLANQIAKALVVYEILWNYAYRIYPKYAPIGKLESNTARITRLAMSSVFDKDVPDWLRPAYPKFTADFSAIIRAGQST